MEVGVRILRKVQESICKLFFFFNPVQFGFNLETGETREHLGCIIFFFIYDLLFV